MDWLERTAGLRQWSRDGVRAPHKPLLLLYALGRFQADAEGELRYSAVEGDLKRLLAEYGPARGSTPACPFHHLVSDGLWEVRTDHGVGSPGTGVRELRAGRAAGRLVPELRAALRREPSMLGRMARVQSLTSAASAYGRPTSWVRTNACRRSSGSAASRSNRAMPSSKPGRSCGWDSSTASRQAAGDGPQDTEGGLLPVRQPQPGEERGEQVAASMPDDEPTSSADCPCGSCPCAPCPWSPSASSPCPWSRNRPTTAARGRTPRAAPSGRRPGRPRSTATRAHARRDTSRRGPSRPPRRSTPNRVRRFRTS